MGSSSSSAAPRNRAAALRLLAPAKINLHLRVGPPTPDGFHPLLTWMCTVALFDTIELQHSSRGTGTPSRVVDGGGSTPLIELTCNDPSVPCDQTNLIAKTAAALADVIRGGGATSITDGGEAGSNTSASPLSSSSTSLPTTREGNAAGAEVGRAAGAQGTTEPHGAQGRVGTDARAASSSPVARQTTATTAASPSARAAVGIEARPSTIRVALHKTIPAGAGLGGGSSDGARALIGLARLWEVDDARGSGKGGTFSRSALADIASRCGSDLPFFFHGPSSACTGRGQFVRPVPPPAVARWAVLVLPAIAMPTPAVYRKFDELRLGDADRLAAEPDWSAWAKLPSNELLPLLVNDLEAPAFALRPELGELRARIESQLGRIVRMSGSGSSLFTLFDDEVAARRAADAIVHAHQIRAVAVEVAPSLRDDIGD